MKKQLTKANRMATKENILPSAKRKSPVHDKPQAGQSGSLSTFELAQLAVTLAGSADSATPAEQLVTRAQEIWAAAEAAQRSVASEELIVATLAKMHDDDDLVAIERKSWDHGKGPSLITEEIWNGLLFSFEGDKQALVTRICRTYIPTAEILAEVFPNARTNREVQLAELIIHVHRRRLIPILLAYVESLCRQLQVDLRKAHADAASAGPLLRLRDRDGCTPREHFMHEVNLMRQPIEYSNLGPVEVEPGWFIGKFRTAWFCRWLIVARQRQLSEKAAEKGGRRK